MEEELLSMSLAEAYNNFLKLSTENESGWTMMSNSERIKYLNINHSEEPFNDYYITSLKIGEIKIKDIILLFYDNPILYFK